MEKEAAGQDLFGRMNDPDGSAWLKGPCGAMTARLAKGMSITESLNISAGEVIKKLKRLSRDHQHCSILALSALYRAIANYLLKD